MGNENVKMSLGEEGMAVQNSETNNKENINSEGFTKRIKPTYSGNPSKSEGNEMDEKTKALLQELGYTRVRRAASIKGIAKMQEKNETIKMEMEEDLCEIPKPESDEFCKLTIRRKIDKKAQEKVEFEKLFSRINMETIKPVETDEDAGEMQNLFRDFVESLSDESDGTELTSHNEITHQNTIQNEKYRNIIMKFKTVLELEGNSTLVLPESKRERKATFVDPVEVVPHNQDVNSIKSILGPDKTYKEANCPKEVVWVVRRLNLRTNESICDFEFQEIGVAEE